MSFLFNHIFYYPLYNALVWLTDKLPGHHIALSVIVLTILVRLILLPFQHKSIRTQMKMKEIDGRVREVRERLSKNKEEQTREIMKLYRAHGVNPLSTFGLILIQLPILIAIYQAFRVLPLSSEHLYSFVTMPAQVNLIFLGIDLASRNIPLAILVGLSQYVQIKLSMPPVAKRTEGASFSDDLARSMQLNMQYFMPVLNAIIATTLPSVLSLYWLTSNIIMAAHEFIVRRKAIAISTVTQ